VTTREGALFENATPTPINLLGIWLGARLIRRRVGSLAGKRIADIGCGYEAITTRPYLKQVHTAYLADLALAPDLTANPAVRPLIGELPGTLGSIPDNQVDVVFCLNVHEHVDEPARLLTECRRILVPGGQFFITVPSWSGKVALEFSAFRLNDGREEMEDHKRYYSKHDLWLAIRAAGFLPSGIRIRHAKFGLSIFGTAKG
jgi:SAM-dependent methyltransferase